MAAVKCPGGRVNEIDISYDPLLDKRGYTRHEHQPADQAFIIYAGPWAQASAIWPGETIYLDRVLTVLRWNDDDWKAFQQAMGHDVSDDDVMKVKIAVADGGDPPPEVRPDETWHEKTAEVLVQAWPELEELASS